MNNKHFDDLTKIDCVIEDLDIDTLRRLFEAHYRGATIEFFMPYEQGRWVVTKAPAWVYCLIYRVKSSVD